MLDLHDETMAVSRWGGDYVIARISRQMGSGGDERVQSLLEPVLHILGYRTVSLYWRLKIRRERHCKRRRTGVYAVPMFLWSLWILIRRC